jgi:hypothetical protein
MPATQPTRAAQPRPAVSRLRSPVSFFPITSAVPASISAESPSNSAVSVTNAAVSQLTSSQSWSPVTTANAANTAASVTNAAVSHLTCSQPHACCRPRQHNGTPAESITAPQWGGGWGGPIAVLLCETPPVPPF